MRKKSFIASSVFEYEHISSQHWDCSLKRCSSGFTFLCIFTGAQRRLWWTQRTLCAYSEGIEHIFVTGLATEFCKEKNSVLLVSIWRIEILLHFIFSNELSLTAALLFTMMFRFRYSSLWNVGILFLCNDIATYLYQNKNIANGIDSLLFLR